MRAIAAVMVLIVHGYPQAPMFVIGLLASAMDLFFIISGFLVVIIADEKTRPWAFMRNRIERIVPLYWIITLVVFCLLYSGVLGPNLDPAGLIGSILRGDWGFLLQSLFFYPGASPFESDMNPLVPQGWTLNYEMFFYLSFAFALYLPRDYMVPVLTFVYATLVACGYVLAESMTIKFWTSPLIFEFVLGLWVGVAWRKQWNFIIVFVIGVLATFVLARISGQFFSDWPFWPQRMALIGPLFAVFIVMLSFDREGSGLGEWKSLRLIGDASFSIYLFHFIPIIFLDRIGQAMHVNEHLYFLVVVLGGTYGGIAVYYSIEQPIARFVKRRRAARTLRTDGPGSS